MRRLRRLPHRAFSPPFTASVRPFRKVSECLEQRIAELERNEQPLVAALLLSPDTPPPIARVEQTATFFMATYTPFVFGYCVFDIAAILHTARATGAEGLLEAPLSCLVSPHSLIRSPVLENRFPPLLLCELVEVVSTLLAEHDASARSLVWAAREQRANSTQLVPFLRGVCMCAAAHHPFTPQAGYVLDALLHSGFVSTQLYLDGSPAERQRVLANLLLAAAREFGSPQALLTALHLLDSERDTAASLEVARSTSLTFSRDDKRRLDWRVKARTEPRDRFRGVSGWTHRRKRATEPHPS